MSRARCARRSPSAPTSSTARKNLDSNDVNIRYFKNQSMPALDLNASYGAQGLGGTALIRTGTGLGSQVIASIDPGRLRRRARACFGERDYPNWNLNVDDELSDWRQPGRRAARARARAAQAGA